MIYKVFILSLVTLSASGALLGANRCTWGPSHWCSSYENARACGEGSEKFCREKVWIGNHRLAPKMTKPIPEDIPAKPVEPEVAPEEFEPLIKPRQRTDEEKAKAMGKMMNPMLGQYTDHKLGGNCALCELIAKEVFSKLKGNDTEQMIIDDMDKICELLPSSFTASCEQFVEEYGKEFWEAFVENVDVHDLCTYIGLCSSEFLSIVKEGNMMAHFLSKNVEGIGCDTCSAVMGLVQKEALANEKQLESLLDQACAVLPVDQSTCDDTVNGMFEALISLFESYKPEELCQMISLCPKETLFDTLMGPGPVALGQPGMTGVASPKNVLGEDDSCQNGPAYWCASPENARECKMEEFCKKESATVF